MIEKESNKEKKVTVAKGVKVKRDIEEKKTVSPKEFAAGSGGSSKLESEFGRNFREEKLLKDLQDPLSAIHYLSESFGDKDYHRFYVALINCYYAQRLRIEKEIKN